MVVARWENCCYALRRDLLALRASDREVPLWLRLEAKGKQQRMRRALLQEAEVHCCCFELS